MSIGQKLTIWIISIVLITGFISIYIYYKAEMQEESERLESFGNTVGQILEQSLDSYMMTRNLDVLDKTLDNISGIKPISKIWLINRETVIKASTDKREVGMIVPLTNQICQMCHEKKPQGLSITTGNTFRWVQPIINKPECFKCHNSSIRLNGIFIIDFSLGELGKYVKRDIFRGSLIFIPAISIIGLAMLLLTKRLIVKRLNAINKKVNQFNEGDNNAQIIMDGKDEITDIADSFNEMIKRLKKR